MTIPVVDIVTAEREIVQLKLEGMHHSRREGGGGGKMGLIINKRYNSNGDVPFKGGWVGKGV